MGHKYTAIAFTEEVKKVQQQHNSRSGYQGMEQGPDYNHLLSQNEADFIEGRDSFYMASVSETNWPYVQHRGGPKGFMKVIDARIIGFADFSGNRQYVSTGNFVNNDRVALFFMDYPNRRRLKMLGRISLVAPDDIETLASLENPQYRATVERGFIIKIEGFDWNCPQHITQRYTEEDIQTLIEPLLLENKELKENQTNALSTSIKTQLKSKVLGTGPMSLVVSGIRQLTPRVRAFELRHPEGKKLPKVNAGSHLEIPVHLENGELVKRHYSICSNPARRDVYEIAVLREEQGSGGSIAVHDQYHLGQFINIEPPKNHFEFHQDSTPAVLFAGGIGITPIKAMAQSLKARGTDFTLHYAGRDFSEMAFRDRLQREFPSQLSLYSSNEKQRMDITNILASSKDKTLFYICGPQTLIDAVRAEAKKQNIDTSRIRFEHFAISVAADAKPITVNLQRSNIQLHVKEDETILDAMLDAGIEAPYSCKTGVCKTCAVKVVNGQAQHKDSVLSESDKSQQNLMCPCVSRADGNEITLDI